MSDINRIDIAEFRRLGFLQELNRRLLHPAGLALEVTVAEDGTETFGGVWDYRDDPEGITFAELGPIELERSLKVDDEIARHVDARRALFDGHYIQPIPGRLL